MVTRERIGSIPLFAGLSPEEMSAVAEIAGEATVESGTILATQGDFGHAFFAVETGTADVVAEGETVATLGPGDVFGEIALLRSGRRTASVIATSPMELLAFFKPDVWRMERELPEVAAALRASIDSRLAPDGA